MKQFLRIFRFEFTYYLKNKIFLGVTLALVALIGVVMCLPRIMENIGDDEPSGEDARPLMLVWAEGEVDPAAIGEAFATAFPEYRVEMTEEGGEALTDRVESGDAECAFALQGLTEFTYYVYDLTLYDACPAIASGLLTELYRTAVMLQSGMSAEQVQALAQFVPQGSTELLGQDQAQNYLYTYLMLMALYMVILLYGQMVATNVASEKSSRAMELLITSVRPTTMMFGKVIASCLAGLTQLVAIFGSALVFYRMNASYFADNEMIRSLFNIPPALLGYMLLFFVLGFFLYAFLFGAIGSTASKLEDINTSTMPLMFLFIIAFLVVMFSMSAGDVNNVAMVICSFIPFTSPMAMFTRLAMTNVPIYEVVISVALLAGSVVGVGVLAAKIYRVGVLLYGTQPRLSAILKAIRRA